MWSSPRAGGSFETHLYRSERGGDRLLGLHDWMRLPGENTISPGDVLVMGGFVAVVLTASRKKPAATDVNAGLVPIEAVQQPTPRRRDNSAGRWSAG